MEEKDLIEALRNRNRWAVNYFVELYQQFIYAVSLQMIEKPEIAEELTQDILVKCIERIDHFQFKSSLKTWVYKVARNETLNLIRKKQHDFTSLDNAHHQQGENNVSQSIEQNEKQEIILRYLQRLNSDQKELLTLFYLKELTIQEISEVLELSINNVKVKLYRARESFSKSLSERDIQLLKELQYE